MPSTKFGLNLIWTAEQNEFNNSESLRPSNACHQVTVWEEISFEEFKMAAILDIWTVF